jgi:hypothetical protein
MLTCSIDALFERRPYIRLVRNGHFNLGVNTTKALLHSPTPVVRVVHEVNGAHFRVMPVTYPHYSVFVVVVSAHANNRVTLFDIVRRLCRIKSLWPTWIADHELSPVGSTHSVGSDCDTVPVRMNANRKHIKS